MRLGCSTCVVVVVFLARSWWHLQKEPLDNKREMFHFAAISECNFHHERQTSPSWHPPAEDGGCQAHCGSAVHSHVEPPAVSLSHRQLFCYFSPEQTRINISINNHRVEKEKHQLVSCWRTFFFFLNTERAEYIVITSECYYFFKENGSAYVRHHLCYLEAGWIYVSFHWIQPFIRPENLLLIINHTEMEWKNI